MYLVVIGSFLFRRLQGRVIVRLRVTVPVQQGMIRP